jgi:mediator of RNA polymerase II transcription subunit 6
LESSLDILRKYKPDYTPRTGFAWPITESEKPGEAHKKQTVEDHPATPSLSDAHPDLLKKLEKEKALTHPKKQQNTALLLNAMRTTAAHPFQLFHEKVAAAAAAAAAPSDAVMSEGRRSSETPVPAPIPSSQSTGSQPSGPSTSQDSAKGAAAAAAAKRKKKRMSRVQFEILPPLFLG